jgi:hypothetical protein
MPRYYFHLCDDVSAIDQEGQELPNADDAKERAVRYARDMSAASIIERGKINLHDCIEVADEGGQIITKVEFGDVVRVET